MLDLAIGMVSSSSLIFCKISFTMARLMFSVGGYLVFQCPFLRKKSDCSAKDAAVGRLYLSGLRQANTKLHKESENRSDMGGSSGNSLVRPSICPNGWG